MPKFLKTNGGFVFEIEYSGKADKFLQKCEPKLKQRLKTVFETLAQIPIPAKEFDLKKIEGEIAAYRIRLSSFRIIYEILWSQKTIRVTKIERRKDRTYKF